MGKKDSLVELIQAYQEQAEIGVPLLDEQGFPRNDIDIGAIRKARNKIACTQNDHIALMREIDKALQELHQAQRENDTKPKFQENFPTKDTKGFAYVAQVKP